MTEVIAQAKRIESCNGFIHVRRHNSKRPRGRPAWRDHGKVRLYLTQLQVMVEVYQEPCLHILATANSLTWRLRVCQMQAQAQSTQCSLTIIIGTWVPGLSPQSLVRRCWDGGTDDIEADRELIETATAGV